MSGGFKAKYIQASCLECCYEGECGSCDGACFCICHIRAFLYSDLILGEESEGDESFSEEVNALTRQDAMEGLNDLTNKRKKMD